MCLMMSNLKREPPSRNVLLSLAALDSVAKAYHNMLEQIKEALLS